MKHLFNYSVLQPVEDLPGNGGGLKDIGCDGIELFTLFEKVPDIYKGISPSVHLPYAVDWYSVWTGKADLSGFDEDNVKYILFGRDRDEIVKNLRDAIGFAAEVKPAYGVLHAGAASLDELTLREQTYDSRDVLGAFCEMMNRVASGFKGGEPPFKLAFENLWWPGLKMPDPCEYEFIEAHIEFDNWGFCLDTGHMMNTLPDATDENTCAERLLEIFERYSDDMKDRIGTMHLHVSTSAGYRSTFESVRRPPGETVAETITRAYDHGSKIDQHRPFFGNGCRALVEEISPDFVTHETMGADIKHALRNFVQQRAHFAPADYL